MSDEREPDRQLLIRRWSKKENDSRIVSAGELRLRAINSVHSSHMVLCSSLYFEQPSPFFYRDRKNWWGNSSHTEAVVSGMRVVEMESWVVAGADPTFTIAG